MTYLLLMSSFNCSAMSKSAAGFGSGGAEAVGGLDIDFLIASDLAREGDMFALILEGDRGISGDTAFEGGAILIPQIDARDAKCNKATVI